MVSRAVAYACLFALAGGCFGLPPDGNVGPGENETWPGAILDEAIFVAEGASLTITGQVRTPGPVMVEGTLRGQNIDLIFEGHPLDPRVIINGGAIAFQNVGFPGAAPVIEVHGGGEFILDDGTGTYPRIIATDGSWVNITNVLLGFSARAAGSRIEASAAEVRIVNSSVQQTSLMAGPGGVIRLVNAGVDVTAFSGEGLVERAWHVRAKVEGVLTGRPAVNASVTVQTVSGAPETTALTGTDGVAYFEVVEIARRNGTLEPRTPHTFQAMGGQTVGLITSENVEVTISTI